MGNPDMWIKILKEQPDETWNMWQIWGELTSRRPMEKYIGYVESHDQALVGDKTLIFRLCDSKMYTDMCKSSNDPIIERGIALHKLIRMITMTLGGEGYLNFMGNEFGHPEWIDFPREGNGWSYFYCRRQWHLADDPNLKYGYLQAFDREMIALLQSQRFFRNPPRCLFLDAEKQVIVYARDGLVFAINFSPKNSYEGYYLPVLSSGQYSVALSSDSEVFGGAGRVSESYVYRAKKDVDGVSKFQIYLPARCGICLKKIKNKGQK